jgi:hypothetical protein
MDDSAGSGADSSIDRSIRFALHADPLGIHADVRLRNVGARWVSVADSQDRTVTGIGSTPRAAILASLDWLGPAAKSALLVDLQLLEVSVRLHEVSAV